MKIINGIITAGDSLEVSLQPGNILADWINPGAWETRANAAGGKGIVWSTPNADLTTPEQYFGSVCKVVPKYRPSVVLLSVETEVSTDNGASYRPLSGQVEIQFVDAAAFTQMAIVPGAGQNVIEYKKTIL